MKFSTEHKKDVCFQGSAPEMQFPARKKINSMFHSTKCTWNAASKKWTILSRPHSVPPRSGVNCIPVYAWINYAIIRHHWLSVWWQGSKFHSSDRLRQTKMTVGQVEYRKDLSDGQLHISDFHISCIGFIYFRQVNGTFGQWFLQSTCPTDKCIQFEISKPVMASSLFSITSTDLQTFKMIFNL